MAFVFAILIFLIGLGTAVFTGFAQGMATAPKYTNAPLWILGWGIVISIFVASTHWHWLPHLGW